MRSSTRNLAIQCRIRIPFLFSFVLFSLSRVGRSIWNGGGIVIKRDRGIWRWEAPGSRKLSLFIARWQYQSTRVELINMKSLYVYKRGYSRHLLWLYSIYSWELGSLPIYLYIYYYYCYAVVQFGISTSFEGIVTSGVWWLLEAIKEAAKYHLCMANV